MIVIRIAITPSLNASSRVLFIRSTKASRSSSLALLLFLGHRFQSHPLRQPVEAGQVGRERLLQAIGLRLQLALDVVVDRAGIAGRPAVAGFDDAQERREAVVDLDREV